MRKLYCIAFCLVLLPAIPPTLFLIHESFVCEGLKRELAESKARQRNEVIKLLQEKMQRCGYSNVLVTVSFDKQGVHTTGFFKGGNLYLVHGAELCFVYNYDSCHTTVTPTTNMLNDFDLQTNQPRHEVMPVPNSGSEPRIEHPFTNWYTPEHPGFQDV